MECLPGGVNAAMTIGAKQNAITNHGLLLSIAHKVGTILKSDGGIRDFCCRVYDVSAR